MATRFFWLPRTSNNNVGTTTRWASSPYAAQLLNGDYNDTVRAWFETITSVSMPSYAVTTLPSLVSTTETSMSFSISPNVSDVYPRRGSWISPSFGPSTYLTTAPQGTIDARGPFSACVFSMPAAFFSYKLRGVSSINPSQFVFQQTSSTQLADKTIWHKSRWRNFALDYHYGWSRNIALWGKAGVAPLLAYVLRPSTNTVIGWLATGQLLGGRGALNSNSGDAQNISDPGPVQLSFGYAYNYYLGNNANVTGIQDGDLIVWEWWATARVTWFASAACEGLPAGPWNWTTDVYMQGGLTDQPFTVNATTGYPNWAPSHNTILTITGDEPYPESAFVDYGTRFNREYGKPINWGFN